MKLKNNLPKNIILPALFGLLFYLFLTLGVNYRLISKSKTFNLIGISLGILSLYGIVIGVLKNRMNLVLGYAGFTIGRFLIGIILPIIITIYQYYFYEPPKLYNSILEKENIRFATDFKKCHKIKYGTFFTGHDTIIRYFENNKDFELIKGYDGQITNRIKWLDSCSYVRFDESNGLTSDYVRLGNFKQNLHYMYSKPSRTHYLTDENIEMVISIK